MPAPIQPQQVKNLDWLLCTHAHGDHMDPQTLAPIMQNNPECKIVAPAAEINTLQTIGIDQNKVVLVNDGDTIDLTDDMSVSVVSSAHEQLKTDDLGQHHFVGFAIRLGRFRVYHPGDCIPYTGLVEKLLDARIDLALMPVNGRDEYRTARGILGNFTLEEALDLCRRLRIPLIMCHHFGMFGCNTIEPAVLKSRISQLGVSDTVLTPQPDECYLLSR